MRATNYLYALSLLGVAGCASDRTIGVFQTGDAGADQAVAQGDGAVLELDGEASVVPREPEIYASTRTSLFRFDSAKNVLTKVGDFDCLAGRTKSSSDAGASDIAVGSDGSIFAVAKVDGKTEYQEFVILSVDKTTAKCQDVLTIPRTTVDPLGALAIFGLSFVRAGSSDGLYALDITGAYLRVDLAAKTVAVAGYLNGAPTGIWKTKGADVVSIAGDRTYSTATKDGDLTESLVAIDPQLGEVKDTVGLLGGKNFGGLGYWGGKLYGFATDGRIYAIDTKTAQTTELPVAIPSGTEFTGAGVTPLAPVDVK
jgi:hypothetical protein